MGVSASRQNAASVLQLRCSRTMSSVCFGLASLTPPAGKCARPFQEPEKFSPRSRGRHPDHHAAHHAAIKRQTSPILRLLLTRHTSSPSHVQQLVPPPACPHACCRVDIVKRAVMPFLRRSVYVQVRGTESRTKGEELTSWCAIVEWKRAGG